MINNMKSNKEIPMKRALLFVIFAIMMLPLFTCEKSDPTAPAEATILLSANPDTVEPDNSGYGTSIITAQVLDEAFNALDGVAVTFSASPSGTLESNGAARKTDENGRISDTLRTNAETTVTARSGSASEEITVSVGEGNDPPNILLDADPNPVKTGNTVIFDGSGSIDSDGWIAGYKWELFPDVDDPEVIPPDQPYGSVPSLVRTYNQQQNIIVKLTVFDNDGAYDQDYIIEEVLGNLPPNAEAGADLTANMSGTPPAVIVRLDGSQSSDPDGNLVRWSWMCGNGTTPLDVETTPINRCRYDLAGQYIVTLTVYDNGGAKDSDNMKVTVTD
jgi:hypothetical protein